MAEPIKMAGREITVHQLTISEVRDYLAYMQDREALRLSWERYETTLEKLREEYGEEGVVVEAPGKPEEELAQPHTVDLLFNDPVTAKAVSMASDMSMEELEGNYSQQEMKALIDAVRGQNPFLLGMMERFASH
jgi:hypothetical protein